MNISVEVEGLDRMERDVRALQRNFDAPIRPVANQLEEITYSEVRAKYASKGASGPGGVWPSNKPETVARYASMNKRGFAVLNEPMRRTDALYKSETTRGAPHAILIVEDDSLTQGTDLRYGLIQKLRDREQYDPTPEGNARRASIVRRGIVKDMNFFDYTEGFGGAAF